MCAACWPRLLVDMRSSNRKMMESAANKLLHTPTTRLRDASASPDGLDTVQAAMKLFDLQEDPEERGVSQRREGEADEEEGLPH